jgi:hypothetical protein
VRTQHQAMPNMRLPRSLHKPLYRKLPPRIRSQVPQVLLPRCPAALQVPFNHLLDAILVFNHLLDAMLVFKGHRQGFLVLSLSQKSRPRV